MWCPWCQADDGEESRICAECLRNELAKGAQRDAETSDQNTGDPLESIDMHRCNYCGCKGNRARVR